jgi:glycosyltransferase involved in cell wall biosynthesis
MKVLIFANKMPDLCGAFLHDVDLAIELQKRGHLVVFLTIRIPTEGVNGGHYRGFRFLHYTAASSFLDTSELWVCPHAPILPEVRKVNSRGYHRPIVATCHYDGNYTMITGNAMISKGPEMLLFVNKVMEPNYRKNIAPWPPMIQQTDTVRPILHREKITISEPFQGEYITLVNANQNKGVHVFVELARRMPDRKFLGVLPYYGEKRLPPFPPNIEWVPFNDDIRTVLRRTRILLVPSYYESYGRIAVEAMINGIPVLYSKPAEKSVYPGGSTEGLDEWIKPAGISCEREVSESWMSAIQELDNPDTYSARSQQCKEHIEAMDLFTEAGRIVDKLEAFSRQNPVIVKVSSVQQQQQQTSSAIPGLPRMPREPAGPVGFGFSNGRLSIRR